MFAFSVTRQAVRVGSGVGDAAAPSDSNSKLALGTTSRQATVVVSSHSSCVKNGATGLGQRNGCVSRAFCQIVTGHNVRPEQFEVGTRKVRRPATLARRRPKKIQPILSEDSMSMTSSDRLVKFPMDPEHPVRLWAEQRNLWRADVPFPRRMTQRGIRHTLLWLPESASLFKGQHMGAGSVVAPVAPIADWQRAYPDHPAPKGLQLIAIDSQGNASVDRPKEVGDWGKGRWQYPAAL